MPKKKSTAVISVTTAREHLEQFKVEVKRVIDEQVELVRADKEPTIKGLKNIDEALNYQAIMNESPDRSLADIKAEIRKLYEDYIKFASYQKIINAEQITKALGVKEAFVANVTGRRPDAASKVDDLNRAKAEIEAIEISRSALTGEKYDELSKLKTTILEQAEEARMAAEARIAAEEKVVNAKLSSLHDGLLLLRDATPEELAEMQKEAEEAAEAARKAEEAAEAAHKPAGSTPVVEGASSPQADEIIAEDEAAHSETGSEADLGGESTAASLLLAESEMMKAAAHKPAGATPVAGSPQADAIIAAGDDTGDTAATPGALTGAEGSHSAATRSLTASISLFNEKLARKPAPAQKAAVSTPAAARAAEEGDTTIVSFDAKAEKARVEAERAATAKAKDDDAVFVDGSVHAEHPSSPRPAAIATEEPAAPWYQGVVNAFQNIVDYAAANPGAAIGAALGAAAAVATAVFFWPAVVGAIGAIVGPGLVATLLAGAATAIGAAIGALAGFGLGQVAQVAVAAVGDAINRSGFFGGARPTASPAASSDTSSVDRPAEDELDDWEAVDAPGA